MSISPAPSGLSRFLRIQVEQTMAGRAELLKEVPHRRRSLRVRKDSFDPTHGRDRKCAGGSLRSRVTETMPSNGVRDPRVIEYSKGRLCAGMRDR